jgi:hypothetical protein
MTTEIDKERLAEFIAAAQSSQDEERWSAFYLDMTEDELVKLSKHNNYDVKRMALGHYNAPGWLLAKKARAKYTYIREAVMSNFNTPVDVLRQGASDKSSFVREVVMGNPNTPDEILQQGLKDKSEWVRQCAEFELKSRAITAQQRKETKNEN